MADVQAFKAKLMAFNKEFKDKTKEEAALEALRDKLGVFELEQNIGREVNKVDCLEEEVPIRELNDEVMRTTKPGYAQAQDPLIKVNIGNEGEDPNIRQSDARSRG
ncbi:Hypothetical predicted protein [Olea europaea subsp. europaea]|uniref:Uncharacterized protein n=1 Tax=Olea europaea subsp. europaea TaxID=158383 RepID=A0A8S0TJU5_OLEEU|nr:Hypothetical predicted protein [Olea europaea subsp. europaea]